jgi:hypothetical protein
MVCPQIGTPLGSILPFIEVVSCWRCVFGKYIAGKSTKKLNVKPVVRDFKSAKQSLVTVVMMPHTVILDLVSKQDAVPVSFVIGHAILELFGKRNKFWHTAFIFHKRGLGRNRTINALKNKKQ